MSLEITGNCQFFLKRFPVWFNIFRATFSYSSMPRSGCSVLQGVNPILIKRFVCPCRPVYESFGSQGFEMEDFFLSKFWIFYSIFYIWGKMKKFILINSFQIILVNLMLTTFAALRFKPEFWIFLELQKCKKLRRVPDKYRIFGILNNIIINKYKNLIT